MKQLTVQDILDGNYSKAQAASLDFNKQYALAMEIQQTRNLIPDEAKLVAVFFVTYINSEIQILVQRMNLMGTTESPFDPYAHNKN